ncbi:hypothetical protein PRECH8_14240 [Insulibacter thermoxylanivorax]|uniref:Uncharacterized protein n=1 Tax=Insulibacter thermoxylanivorax TaxID=2749268 RepID=A0A916QEU3_9BACL|nr:hypothetical protein PRECH8_14240 [Insulibacter thermoxylanivorax]
MRSRGSHDAICSFFASSRISAGFFRIYEENGIEQLADRAHVAGFIRNLGQNVVVRRLNEVFYTKFRTNRGRKALI